MVLIPYTSIARRPAAVSRISCSLRTTAPYRVRPSGVGCPPRSRALQSCAHSSRRGVSRSVIVGAGGTFTRLLESISAHTLPNLVTRYTVKGGPDQLVEVGVRALSGFMEVDAAEGTLSLGDHGEL